MVQDVVMRARTFKMRLSEQEWAWLVQIAEHYAIEVAQAIRLLAKREVDRLASETPPRKPDKHSPK